MGLIALSLVYALYEGIIHAFEADHLLAVSTLISRRNKTVLFLRDGIFWGLGHTSTIFLAGIMIILFKINLPEALFGYLEAIVGGMLILVASLRLYSFVRKKDTGRPGDTRPSHRPAYNVGFIHGLAGSGTLILLVMAQISSVAGSLLFLLVFGLGSVIGMALVSVGMGWLYQRKDIFRGLFYSSLVVISSLACLVYGVYIIYENIVSV